MNTVGIGRIGEKAAAKFLKKNKYRILKRNAHFSHNEIDIIAQDKKHIVFVEVKTRSFSENNFGSPALAVTRAKQKRTITAAKMFLSKYKKERQPRFDVIEVFLNKETKNIIKINHIINAFNA